jgi:hypothetical protein
MPELHEIHTRFLSWELEFILRSLKNQRRRRFAFWSVCLVSYGLTLEIVTLGCLNIVIFLTRTAIRLNIN